MNTRILLSVLTILGVVALAGTGAYAAFSAQATNTGNTFGAGTLTLQINPGASPSPAPVFSFTDIVPGQSKSGLFKLHNSGTVDAGSVQIATIDTTGSGTHIPGHVTVSFFHDIDGNGVNDGIDTPIAGSGKLNDPSWTGYTLPGVAIAHGADYNLGTTLTLDLDTPNDAQGELAQFSITFKANQ